MPMLTAGFGDILGNFTALRDWQLSRVLLGEYYCQEAAALMERAVERCAQNAQGLAQRDLQAVEAVTQALILSGVAMGMVGNSRPASGAEHHMAHYWRWTPWPGERSIPSTATRWGRRQYCPPACTSWRRTSCPRGSLCRTTAASLPAEAGGRVRQSQGPGHPPGAVPGKPAPRHGAARPVYHSPAAGGKGPAHRLRHRVGQPVLQQLREGLLCV